MPHECSKCSSDMEEGFLLEMGDVGVLSPETWVAGKPDKGIFGLKLRGKRVHEVVTYRCISCGYLDSYALPQQ